MIFGDSPNQKELVICLKHKQEKVAYKDKDFNINQIRANKLNSIPFEIIRKPMVFW